MSHTRRRFAGGVSLAGKLKERLLNGSEVSVTRVAKEFYGESSPFNKIKARVSLITLRRHFEKSGTRTLICRDGVYKLINKPKNRTEKKEALAETHLRSGRVGSSFHSLGNQVTALLYHDSRQLPYVERSLIEIEDLVRNEKRKLLAKKLGTRKSNLFLADRRTKKVKNRRIKK